MPRAVKGQRFGGRIKGTPNKVTASLKDAIMRAATLAGEDLQVDKDGKPLKNRAEGLIHYLRVQATINPQSFIPLLGRVLPLQIDGDIALVVQVAGGLPDQSLSSENGDPIIIDITPTKSLEAA